MLRKTGLLCVLFGTLACSALAKEKYQQPGPVHLDHEGDLWAKRTLRKLSTEEKVGQLFLIWVRAEFLNINAPEYLELRKNISKYHLGGFTMTVPWDPPFLYRSQPYEAAELLNRLQQDSTLPLLIAADFERGVSMRLHGATEFPHAMAFGAAGKLEYAEAFGRITAQEARAVGVHWNFFPDADVNSNPANPIINTRSFGEDPKQVGDLVTAYIRGAQAHGMMATVKHFPGHGDTATDSHLGVAQVTGDMTRLRSVELPPFQQAIAAGVDSVMVAHVSVPALDSDPNRVATTSPEIVTGLLKNQLGFKGIVVTDALDMAGLTRLYGAHTGRAAVDAFKAGNDVLLIPADLDASYRAMVEAVHSGEISPARLDASVLKILKAKASLNLHKTRLVNIEAVSTLVGKPDNRAVGQQIADASITLVRDNGKLLPLKSSGTTAAGLPYQRVEEVRDSTVVIIFSDDMRTEAGRKLERQIRERVPDANVMYVDPRIASVMADDVLKAVDNAKSVIAAVYEVPVAGKMMKSANGVTNSVGLSDASGTLLQKVLDHAAEKTAVLAMGNPYLAQDFPAVQNYLCTFSNATVSEVSAVKALFGEIAIQGHLPVSIPNIAQRGAGIERPGQAAQGGSRHADSQILDNKTKLLIAAGFAMWLTLLGCSVSVKDHDGDGKSKVDISTPVGGIHVDENADARDTGLAVYPAARPKAKTNDGDKKSANVNLSAFGYGLKVVALEYESDDSPDKIIAYYQDQLKKYGGVLQCHSSGNSFKVDDDGHKGYVIGGKLKCDSDDNGKAVELKAGTDDNQHIVSVEPQGKGSDFSIVWVRVRGKEGDI